MIGIDMKKIMEIFAQLFEISMGILVLSAMVAAIRLLWVFPK